MTTMTTTETPAYVEQGSVTAGDTVYVQSYHAPDVYRPLKTTVARVTKTIVYVKIRDGIQAFRWNDNAGNYSQNRNDHYSYRYLITEAAGDALAEQANTEHRRNELRLEARNTADELARRSVYVTPEKLTEAAEKLTRIANELAAL